ncbi:arabinofuranosyltransferase [Nonomuraea longicatena]|uniref:Galactan 5-O-arabinofuranosyltransferase n=1 Tax=Nonomuraea longicatena TaxID=83682 RepID=A0ABN1PEY6_9ACTN
MTTSVVAPPRLKSISPLAHPSYRGPLLAVPVWLATTAAGFALVGYADPDPFTVRGAVLSLAVFGLLAMVALPVGLRLRGNCAVVCGLFAGWLATALRAALNGTPYGFAGLYGDMGRIAAAATRYTATPWSADAFVEEVPAEYPMLYPWLIGRASVLSGVPAWRLVAEAEILTVSGAVVAAFLLWTRLVRAPIALGIVVAGVVAFGDPRKAFGVLTVLMLTPWVLLAFGTPPRGRLQWWAAGLIGGLMVMTYQGYLMYGAPGILAVAALAWWRSGSRRAYVLHVLGVLAVAFAVSACYVVPYAWAYVTAGGQQVADLYIAPDLAASPFPFLQPTPLGLLQFAGLAGTVFYRRSTWWAAPLLCLIAGAYVYRVLMMTRFVIDGHTGFYHYTSRLLGPLLAAAGVLAVATMLRRKGWSRYAAAALSVLVLWAGVSYWRISLPEDTSPWREVWPSREHYRTAQAHREPVPGEKGALPVARIERAVERAMGPGARPRVLAFDERLYAFLPWRGYLAVDRTSANTLSFWDDRRAELARLAEVTDPAGFTRASAATAFGPIDVFVLKSWRWRDIRFRPAQFSHGFEVVDDLPDHTVLLIRE